jgi:hypothetical protein
LVSYSRFVELLPRALVPLCGYLHGFVANFHLR